MAGLGLLALGAGTGTLAGCASARPEGETLLADPALRRLLESVIGVDMHSHAAGANGRPAPTYDLGERMRQGRMTAVVLGHSGDNPVLKRDADNRVQVAREPKPGELWQFTRRRLDWCDDLVSSQRLRRFLAPGEIEAAGREGTPGIVQAIEGCQFLEGRVERIEEVHRRGVRHLQLVHFLRSDLGDHQTESPVHGGMTPLGREVIAECNRLGIVVDVAHGTLAFVESAAQACRAPLILSHTNLTQRPLHPFTRLISGDHGKVVAQTGGVVGIWGAPSGFKTLTGYVEGIARAVDRLGVEHVGFGTDNSGFGRSAAVWSDYADFPLVVHLLRKRGFAPEEIRKIAGGNYVRVFNASLRPA
jgi:membrane dipeptidase